MLGRRQNCRPGQPRRARSFDQRRTGHSRPLHSYSFRTLFTLQCLFTLQYSTPPAQFLTFSDSDDAHVGQRVCTPLF